jgi:hypothetical protein
MGVHRMALRLGRTVAEISRTMSAQEYMAWCLFFEQENKSPGQREADSELMTLFPGSS